MFDLFGLERNHKIGEDEEVDLLTTVYDVVMLGIIRGLLEDEKIPYLVHERGTGSAMRIMTGFSMFGTDIFVPKAAMERARGLIAGLEENGEPVEFLDEEGNPIDPAGDDDDEDTEDGTDGADRAEDEGE